MSTPPEVPGKRESLDTRIEPEGGGLIDRAAKARLKPRLRRTMQTPAPWDNA